MKLFLSAVLYLLIIVPTPALYASRQSDQSEQPDLSELTETPESSPQGNDANIACAKFHTLNCLIRDRRVGKETARGQLKSLLAELRKEYYRAGGSDQTKSDWVFPLSGYDARAITGGRSKGYIAQGYDYFAGNRHGGHPAFDIFIRDRDQDCLDDRTGRPVKVLSMTGGIVVAVEREWKEGSILRGGKYIWVYDPSDDLLVYYAHNGELFVGLGEIVKPGDLLATVGRSGYNAAKRRSPTHLHLSVLQVRDGRPLPVNVYRDLLRAKKL